MVVHHSVFDRESLEIFNEELAAAYEAICAGVEPDIGPLPLQYAEFAEWERGISPEVISRQLAYWEEQLRGADLVLELPTSWPRPLVQSFRADSIDISVPGETVGRLRDFAADIGATIFMVCLAAYQALLFRYTGAEDIVVGIPINQRTQKTLEGMIGFFINSLPICLKTPGDPRFSDLAEWVKEIVIEAYENRYAPFEEIAARLRPDRDMSRNPVMQAWFDLASSARPGASELLHLAGAQAYPFDTSRVWTRFDLEMHIFIDDRGAIAGRIIYASDVLERSMAQQLGRHYENFLNSIAANPGEYLSQISIFDADEFSMIIDRWGAAEDAGSIH